MRRRGGPWSNRQLMFHTWADPLIPRCSPYKPWFAKYPMCSGVGQHLCTVCPRTSDLTSPGEQAHDPQVASLNGVRRADLLQEPAGGNAARTPAPRIGLQEQKVM